MKRLFLFLLLSLPGVTSADDYRHLVSIGPQGLGWSGAVERMETEDASPFSDVEHFLSNLSLNYGYRVDKRMIVGGFYSSSHNEYKFRSGSGTARTESETSVLGIYGLYHFSDTISSAWYAGLSLAQFSVEQETSHNVALAENKNPFELDDAGVIYEIVAGKRFRLLRWNIDHLTYAPQVSFFAKTHSKDLDDQDVKTGFGIAVQPVRFDFLF